MRGYAACMMRKRSKSNLARPTHWTASLSNRSSNNHTDLLGLCHQFFQAQSFHLGKAKISLFMRMPLQCSLDGTHPTYLFLQFLFRVPVCIGKRFGGFSQIMVLTQLVGNARPRMCHRLANRMLPIGNDSGNGDLQPSADGGHFLQQGDQVLFGRSQQTAREF